jgi:hypothetical protein
MNSPAVGLRLASAVFGVIAIMQLVRLLTQVEITVAGHVVPLWANAVVMVVAVGLAAWMWRLSTLARIGWTH